MIITRPRSEKTYVRWPRRFVSFHGMRHPAERGPEEIGAFVSSLADGDGVSASTQSQATSAILFLYRTDRRRDCGQGDGRLPGVTALAVPARRPYGE